MSLGFGSYRISNKSEEHKDALVHALDEGLDFIDTSANYTDGQSELLIGEVLKDRTDKPFIMTKAGYIQGSNQEVINQLNEVGLAKDGLIKVSETLWHSINPDFLRNQVDLSLNRLGVDSIDCFLLHNPEYYFHDENATQEEYYNRIKEAFLELEALVEEGKIKSYGISSNNFVLALDDPKVTNFKSVIEKAEEIENHHFEWIQFPFNLIEIGALEKYYDGFSLLELAKEKGIKTAINRPLNAFSNGNLIRLAHYDPFLIFMDKSEGEELFKKCVTLMDEKILESGEKDETFLDLPLAQQFEGLYHNLPTEDAVEQVYMGHFFPMVARIWGGDLTPEASIPFYDLFDYSTNRARQRMTAVAKDFEAQAINSGLITSGEDSLQERVISKYLEYGFDRILVGMKRKIYVDQMKKFFHG